MLSFKIFFESFPYLDCAGYRSATYHHLWISSQEEENGAPSSFPFNDLTPLLTTSHLDCFLKTEMFIDFFLGRKVLSSFKEKWNCYAADLKVSCASSVGCYCFAFESSNLCNIIHTHIYPTQPRRCTQAVLKFFESGLFFESKMYSAAPHKFFESGARGVNCRGSFLPKAPSLSVKDNHWWAA